MTDQPDVPRYLVIGPMGTTEGPYTPDALRERLRTGRITAEDRYLDAATQTTVDLLSVVPEAAELVREARRRTSDRIRRRSSDRHAAVAEAVAASSSREPAAVVASSAREPAAVVASSARQPAAEPAPITTRPTSRTIGLRHVLIAVAVAVGLTLAIGGISSLAEDEPDLTPTVQYLGNGLWTLDTLASAALAGEAITAEAKARHLSVLKSLQDAGGLIVELHPGDVNLRTGATSSFHHWKAFTGNGRHLSITLLPPHPLLGARLSIRDDGDNRILSLDDQGVHVVLRPKTP